MINIEWGSFIFQVEGTSAILISALPALVIMQIPTVQRLIRSLVRRARNSKLINSIEYKIKKAEKDV